MASVGASMGTESGGAFGSHFMDQVIGMAEKASVVVAGIAATAGAWGVKIASQNEQATISFETMLGSAEKAGTFLQELKDFAATTPFEFPELQTAASSLVAAGINAEKIIPIMTSLGDVTSGMGTGAEGVKRATVALQQMSNAGRITGEDLNQLRDAGVPVFNILSAATGKTKEELTDMARKGELGKKEMEALFTALESGKGLEQFNGLMEKQSQSLQGLFSTFKDTLGQGLADAMAPVLPVLKDVLKTVTDVLNPLLKAVGPHVAMVFGTLAKGLAEVIKIGEPVIHAVVTVAGALIDALVPAVLTLMPFITRTVDILAGALTMALQGITPTLVELVKAIGPILPLLARLIGTGFVIFVTVLNELAKAFAPVIEILVAELVPVFEDLTPLWLDLATAIIPLAPQLARLVRALAPMITLFLTFQARIMEKFGPQLVPLIDKFVEFARVGTDQVVPVLEKIAGWATRLFDAFLAGDQAKIDEVTAEIGKQFDGLWENTLKPGFKKGLDVIMPELQKWWDNTAWPWFEDKWNKLKDNIVQWLKDTAPGQIAVASANMFIGIYNSFVDTINAILIAWNGIRFGEVKAGDHVIFEGFTPPQVELLTRLDRFAKGGRPRLDQPSLVGELGPELFVPDSAGTVVPNKSLGGFNIEHLEVHGQDQPAQTAFAIRSELRWLSMTAGGA
jgi:tape measure domain-containing protein